MLNKLLSIVAYTVLFLLATVLFVYFLFPLDQLRQYVEARVNLSSKYRLEVGSIERDGLGRMVLSDLSVGVNRKLFKRKDAKSAALAQLPAPEAGVVGEAPEEPADEADEFSYIDIEKVTIDFDLTELLDPSSVALGLNVELLGGLVEDANIEFVSTDFGTRAAVHLPTIQDLQFGETEFFGALFSALLPSMRSDKVTGYLGEGRIELEPANDEEDAWYKGEVEIELGDIVALEPILLQRMPNIKEAVEVPLTDMRLGRCIFRLRVDRKDNLTELDKVKTKHQAATVILFEKAECKGESLDYYIKENSFILLPPKTPFSKGNMDFWTKLAFNPDYFEEERKDEAGQPLTKNKELGQGLEFDRSWQKAQDVDGFYWMHCKGKLSKPRCKRGLPTEEKRRKDAIKELERKQEKEEAAKRKEEERKKALERAAAGAGAAGIETAPKETNSAMEAAEKRREEARKRAEERRKEREARRAAQTPPTGVRQPTPPPTDAGLRDEPEGHDEGLEPEGGYEEGEEYPEEEGTLEGEEGEEGAEGVAGEEYPPEGVDEAYPPAEEGGEHLEGEPYEGEGERVGEPLGEGEELPPEGEEPMVAPFP
jgi:hypothetical protein